MAATTVEGSGTGDQSADLSDVTILCKGHVFRTHSLILAAASTHLRNIFTAEAWSDKVSMVLDDADPCDVQSVLDYLRKGAVRISPKNYAGFMNVAKFFRIDGLDYNQPLDLSHSYEVEVQIRQGPCLQSSPVAHWIQKKSMKQSLVNILEQDGPSSAPSPILRAHANQKENLPTGLSVKEMMEALKRLKVDSKNIPAQQKLSINDMKVALPVPTKRKPIKITKCSTGNQ